jgi:hypothetical protein
VASSHFTISAPLSILASEWLSKICERPKRVAWL